LRLIHLNMKHFALVKSKVKLLAVMGGLNNDGFNFIRHSLVDQSQYVLENWPGTAAMHRVAVSLSSKINLLDPLNIHSNDNRGKNRLQLSLHKTRSTGIYPDNARCQHRYPPE